LRLLEAPLALLEAPLALLKAPIAALKAQNRRSSRQHRVWRNRGSRIPLIFLRTNGN
jgi:hypothetical protein